MKTSTIKTQILDNYTAFSPIAKVADVQAEIKGTKYRVKITKGEVTKIMADRKAVWTPAAEEDAITFIDKLVHPVAAKKIEPKTEAVVKPTTKKATSTAKKEKTSRRVIDSKWIAHLVEEANKSPYLQEGDEIRFRVATSHGKPVCAHIDLYTDGEKIATAGIYHRVGFASTGITARWTDRVDAAIKHIYSRIGTGQMIKKDGAVVKVDNGSIVSAEGPVTAVLAILKSV